MEDQVEVIKSNKGGMKVIHKGYMYTVHKKRQCGGIRWRCAQRSLHCKGSISTGTEGPPKINMPHNHLPDLHSVALARGRQTEDFGHFTQLLDIKFEEDPVLKRPLAVPTMRRRGRYSRHLYNAYDLDLKRSVVIFAEQNGNKEAQAHYGISEANIRRWRRLKHDIFGKSPRESAVKRRRVFDYRVEKPAASEESSEAREVPVVEGQDSMPLQERLSKVVAQEKIAAGSGHQMLKSQPLSPTKLKVTRQSSKAAAAAAAPKQAEPQAQPNEEMCLRWNSHHSNMQTAFPNILLKEQYVDVTLAAEGKTLKCHRLILSSCSPYFEEILSGISPFQHPVLFMRDIPFWILKSLCDFMYAGEVHIYQNKLEELLTVAEALKIKGLAGKSTPPENHQEEASKPEAKKRQTPAPQPPPLKKNPIFTSNNYESTSQEYDNEDLLDPLDLLEPLYEEAAEEKKPASQVVKPKENKYQYQPIKKPFTRRLRKRKYSEQRDPSPPPVFSFRKGTRSRPNVKIPKYYHSDYNSQAAKATPNSQADPLLDVDEIKTEPIDVEDNLIDYSDEENQYMENSLEQTNNTSPIIITSSTKPPASPSQDKFKKIKLSKPIITEVHTIEETNTTAGGLEVIKITMQPEVEEEKGKENGGGECQVEGTLETDIVEEETEIGGLEPQGVAEEKREETVINQEEAATNQEEAAVEAPPPVLEPVPEEAIESVPEQTEEERRTASLDHLEKEAMNVANAINKENQEVPPDIEQPTGL